MDTTLTGSFYVPAVVEARNLPEGRTFTHVDVQRDKAHHPPSEAAPIAGAWVVGAKSTASRRGARYSNSSQQQDRGTAATACKALCR